MIRTSHGAGGTSNLTGDMIMSTIVSTRITFLVFAGLFAGIPLISMPGQAVSAPEDCLSGPNRQSPEGSHWYYRVDRPTNRRCWYLGPVGEKVRSTARKAERHRMPLTPPAANATSETPASAPLIDQPRAAASTAQLAQDAAQQSERPVAQATQSKVDNIVISSRWPEPPAAADGHPTPTETSAADAASTVEARFSADDPDPAGPQAGSSEPSAPSINLKPMLAVLIGALVFGGIVTRLTFRHSPGRARRRAMSRRTNVNRRPSPLPHESILPILAKASAPRRFAPVPTTRTERTKGSREFA